jgi:hypothetical protein
VSGYDGDDILTGLLLMVQDAHPEMSPEQLAELVPAFAEKVYGLDEIKEGRTEAHPL